MLAKNVGFKLSNNVVAFDRIPKTKKELEFLLFADDDEFLHPYPHLCKAEDRSFPREEVTDAVWKDIKKPLTAKEVCEAFASGYINGSPELPDYNPDDDDRTWDAWYEACDKFAAEQAKKFMEGHKGKVFLKFEYGDDYELGCALEHGDLFARLPHQRISHH